MHAAASAVRKPAPDAVLRRLVLVPGVAVESDDDRAIRLSHEEARARYELGRAAARFLAIKGWEPLAFARVGDYARERLGISGRELQSFAFVASRLAELPLIAAAFFRGDISWSQARLLCAVAAADSESAWLERARGLTVRDLVVEIRRSETAIAAYACDTLDDESDATEGEPRTQFSILAPPRVALLWRRALELARRMLGSQAPVWQAAEAMVAEASSATPIEIEDVESTPNAMPPLRTATTTPDDPLCSRDLPSPDPHALDDEMRDLAGILSQLDAELGASLRRVVDLRLHRALGFDSFDSYVRERLGISPAKARALVVLDRRSRESCELGRAIRSGELSWVRALAISPVAKGAFESAWVARASEVMVRRLQDEVEWALDMRDACGRPAAPPEADSRLERPDLQT